MVAFTKKNCSLILLAVLLFAAVALALFAPAALSAQAEPASASHEVILESSLQTTATETAVGSRVLRSVSAGDTFTITYGIIKNDGLVESLFTPKYDKTKFALTAFTVNGSYWELMDDYGYEVTDPVTQEVTYEDRTAAEYIAEYNDDLANGRTPVFSRLSFNVYYGGVREDEHILSPYFIRVTYTALCDMVAPVEGSPEFSFGFDMSNGGRLTNAASDSSTLLTLLYKTGMDGESVLTAPLSENMETFNIIAATQVSLQEQTISFHYDANLDPAYYLDTADIALTFVAPSFAANETNPYLADGGSIRYEFYTKNDLNEYVLITDENTDPALPTIPSLTDYYVKAILPATTHFEGTETGIVPIAVAPLYVDVPALLLFDSEHGETPAALDQSDLTLTSSVKYGTALALKETVDNEDILYQPNEVLVVSYYKYNGAVAEAIDYDPLTATLPSVGVYEVVISTADPVYVVFDRPNESNFLSSITITLTITKADLALKAFVYGETSKHITYGDAAPEEGDLTYEVIGAFETGDALAALISSLNVQVTSAAPYAQYSHVGEYVYTATSNEDPENYAFVNNAENNATLIVDPKALTLDVSYEDGTATITYGGIVNDDTVSVTLQTGDAVLAVDQNDFVLTANATYYAGGDLTVKALPDPSATDYTFASLALRTIHKVSFEAGALFAGAQNMPSDQYVFDECFASCPAEVPTFDRYAFSYWKNGAQEYLFDSTAVTGDVTLTAAWEKMVYAYRFRALYAGADYATGSYYELNYDEQAGKFVYTAADEQETALFTKNTAIPMNAQIKGFYLQRWIKAVPQGDDQYLYSEVNYFDVESSVDTNENAFYIAEMVLNIGRGDVNGDGEVTAKDVLAMKRYLVGATYHEITTMAEAWETVKAEAPAGGYFYTVMWDVNGDTFSDARDILYIREALATGYGYAVVKDTTADGVYCPGEQIAREDGNNYQGHVYLVDDLDELNETLAAGKKAALTADIESEFPLVIHYDSDLYVDLGGKTLTVSSFTLSVTGKMTILNGTLNIDTLSLTAPGGITIVNVKDGAGETVTGQDGSNSDFGWQA